MSNPDLQSRNHKEKHSSYKITRVAMASVLVALLAFAGFATFSVNDIATTVEDHVLANVNGVPEAWTNYSKESKLETTISSRIVNNSYIEYTLAIKNNDNSHSASLTHLSSYVSNGDKNGFISLNDDSLEYSYSDTESKSWNNMNILEPSNKEDGFKLEKDIYLGKEGTTTDTVYFRYIVSPSEEGKISDKVSVLAKSDSGKNEVATAENDIEYNKPDEVRLAAEAVVRENPTVARQDPNDESGEYAKPLGVESNPNSGVISTSSLGSVFLSPNSFAGNNIIILGILAVFVVCLAVYLVARNRGKKAKK